MLHLIAGITSFMQKNFPDFVGSYLDGNQQRLGPFLDVAPELVNSDGTGKPYMTMKVFGQPMDQGFISAMKPTMYVEKPRIRFQVWDTSSQRAMKNIEKLCATLDKLGHLKLSGGESVVSLLRTENPQNLPQPIGRTGQRMYCWYQDYEWRVQRTLGV